MNKEGIKTYELVKLNSKIHDNLEVQTISSNSLNSAAKSASNSPIQKNWASKAF